MGRFGGVPPSKEALMERDPEADREPTPETDAETEQSEHPPEEGDRGVSVEEESEQSFPASDPPPY